MAAQSVNSSTHTRAQHSKPPVARLHRHLSSPSSLSHWHCSYPFLFALRVISLSFHLSNWSARLFALLLSSNCSLMCHNCKVRQRFCTPFSALCFMLYVFCLGLITAPKGEQCFHLHTGLSLSQDVLTIQFSFSLGFTGAGGNYVCRHGPGRTLPRGHAF